MVSTVIVLALAGALFAGSAQTARADEQEAPPSQKWSFAGPFGKFDRGSLQRGLEGLQGSLLRLPQPESYIAFRNLADAGGPGYSEAQAAAFAVRLQGQGWSQRPPATCSTGPAVPPITSPRRSPMSRPRAASNGGAAPPDLSLITKARSYERGFPKFVFDFFTQFQEQGPNYVDALILQGFRGYAAEAGVTIPARFLLQQIFPRPLHQDAQAPERWPGHVR